MKREINDSTIVTGANGFTGRFVCKELKRMGIKFIALVRPGSKVSWLEKELIPIRYADLNNYNQVLKCFKDCNALINVASIGFGNAPIIVEACKKAGIKRAVFVSTTSIFTKLNSSSKEIRIEAENFIINSGLEYTIIRPTMIFGTKDDRNIFRLIKWINRFPVIPVFKRGLGLQQPIYVKDLAYIIANSIKNSNSKNQIFNIAGPKPIEFRNMIKSIANIMNKKIFIISINPTFAILIIKIFKILYFKSPISEEQIKRVIENKVFSIKKAKSVFNFEPKTFEEAIKEEIKFLNN